MELDKRIRDVDTIQTILKHNNDIGCKGYFFDNFVQAKVLTKTHYGTLVDIDVVDTDDHCFKARDENGNNFIGYYRFFIPENDLKPVEKKYRPFSLEEWKFNHYIGGSLILYRYKGTYCGDHREVEVMYVGYVKPLDGVTDKAGNGSLVLGNECHSLQNLFDNYEMWVDGGWKPFGVEEE